MIRLVWRPGAPVDAAIPLNPNAFMESLMRSVLRTIAAVLVVTGTGIAGLSAQQAPPPPPAPAPQSSGFGPGELVNAGHQFFGTISRGLAQVIEKAISI